MLFLVDSSVNISRKLCSSRGESTRTLLFGILFTHEMELGTGGKNVGNADEMTVNGYRRH